MEITTPAIVFSSVKFGETDLIVSCFTRSDGIKSYILKGILKSRKGKLKTSYFQPLTQLEIVAFHKYKGTLERIKEAKVMRNYQSLHSNIVKSGMVMFLAEVLKNSIKEEEPNNALYEFLVRSLDWLDRNDAIGNFHIYFLIRLSAYLGFYPDTSNMEGQYFNLSEGNFLETPIGTYCEKGESVNSIKGFFGIDFDEIRRLKHSKKSRIEMLNLVLLYYQFHLQGFKKPKSIGVLNQLF